MLKQAIRLISDNYIKNWSKYLNPNRCNLQVLPTKVINYELTTNSRKLLKWKIIYYSLTEKRHELTKLRISAHTITN